MSAMVTEGPVIPVCPGEWTSDAGCLHAGCLLLVLLAFLLGPAAVVPSAHRLLFLPIVSSGTTSCGASSLQMTLQQSPASSCQRPWMMPWTPGCRAWMTPPSPGLQEARPQEDPLSLVVSEDSQIPSSSPIMMPQAAWSI